MKKILLGLILLMITTMVFAGDYLETTGNYTTTIQKGWNLLPPYTPTSSDNPCLNNIEYDYFYSTSQKSYFGGKLDWANVNGIQKQYKVIDTYFPSKTVYDSIITNEFTNPIKNGQPYQSTTGFGAQWIYSNNFCTHTRNIGTQSTYSHINQEFLNKIPLKKGWNIINFNPWMIGKEIPSIFKNCELTAANSWSSTSQTWNAPSSSAYADLLTGPIEELRNVDGIDSVNEQMIGQTLIIKVANDCYLNYDSESLESPQAVLGKWYYKYDPDAILSAESDIFNIELTESTLIITDKNQNSLATEIITNIDSNKVDYNDPYTGSQYFTYEINNDELILRFWHMTDTYFKFSKMYSQVDIEQALLILQPLTTYTHILSQELSSDDMYFPKGDTQLRELYSGPKNNFEVIISDLNSNETAQANLELLKLAYPPTGNFTVNNKTIYIRGNDENHLDYYYASENKTFLTMNYAPRDFIELYATQN